MANARVKLLICIQIVALLAAHTAYAIVGCTLNDPDRDIPRLFPESTGYETAYITIEEKGGEALNKEIEKELGGTFEPIYETIDVPYAFYTVFRDKKVIGYVHGVNQKGRYGGMQLMISSGMDDKVRSFWYHKLSSPEAAAFVDTKFTDKFTGLTSDDLIKGNYSIADPSKNGSYDFRATLRGLKKNRILLKKLLLEGAVSAR